MGSEVDLTKQWKQGMRMKELKAGGTAGTGGEKAKSASILIERNREEWMESYQRYYPPH